MKLRVRVIAMVVLVLVAASAWWSWRGRDGRDATSTERVQAGAADAILPDTSPDASTGLQRPQGAQVARVEDMLASAIEARGHDDALVRDLEGLALSACRTLDVATVRAAPALPIPRPSVVALRHDPTRRWALDYLERACAGYDVTAMQQWRPEAPDLVVAIEMGGDAATSVALDDLRDSGSITELILALDHLTRNGRLPAGMAVQREGVQSPMRVIEFAVEPIRCRAMGSCRGASLETASRCLATGCPRGITYEQLLRNAMPPAEVAAGLALREQILRYRASR